MVESPCSMKTSGIEISNRMAPGHLRLLLIFVGVALLARGGVLSRGFAIDDYFYGQGFTNGEFASFLTQGRFLLAVIDRVINSLGVNINDIYVSLGFSALLLQAGLVLSILRFVGAADRPGAAIAGSLMVAHPYFAEILTFRMVLPGYCVGTLLAIITLESAARAGEKKTRNLLISLAATVGMLFVYQGFLNYFSVALIFCFLFSEISGNAPEANAGVGSDHRRRIINLLLVCIVSVLVFLVVLSVFKRLGVIEITSRAKFIELKEVPERISKIFDLIATIYWREEPLGAHWLKVLLAAMLVVAGLALSIEVLRNARAKGQWPGNLAVLPAVLLLVPATVGVILPFKDWWPMPRVLSQAGLIIGLFFLLAYPILRRMFAKIPGGAFALLPAILITFFVFKNNQVFADQQRLNSWEKMKINRIIARLEQMSDFSKVEYIFLSKGEWKYPAKLNSIHGDMNVSALTPEYSRVPLLIEASGYAFKPATGTQIAFGEGYCKSAPAWPSEQSVSIVGSLAIVCLELSP
ncbi:hypothetical protein M2282_002694 [Variovorax boronicumulans]|uniref:glucosyltransferase domain-containing protein n=1 Tax=Variovorax boronicumulans TaxID=436515 RepID=UPI002476615F|nr:glucosyltransferase domain-containing protein [Variovorax boronicumulans]MDH6167544.1 hypothetical protein [Variovorax boronicumulans]